MLLLLLLLPLLVNSLMMVVVVVVIVERRRRKQSAVRRRRVQAVGLVGQRAETDVDVRKKSPKTFLPILRGLFHQWVWMGVVGVATELSEMVFCRGGNERMMVVVVVVRMLLLLLLLLLSVSVEVVELVHRRQVVAAAWKVVQTAASKIVQL